MTESDCESEYEDMITVILDRVEKDNPKPEYVPAPHFSNLYYTKACQNAERGFQCSRVLCTFAHTIAQMRILPCRDRDRCRYKNTTCRFIHGDETKDSYFLRTGCRPKLPDT